MAIVFQDDFESNDFSAWDNDISGTIATSNVQVNEGTYSARNNLTSSTTGFARKAVYGSNQTGSNFARCYIYIATATSTTVQVLRFSNTSNAHVGSIRMTSSRTLQLHGANNAQIGSASSALSLNTWYCIELKITAPSNPGTLEARIDESVFASGNNSSQGSFARLLFGVITPNSTGDLYFDSFVLDDASYPGMISTGYTMTMDQGSYTLTGQNLGLARRYTLILAQGAYSLTGQTLNLLRQAKIAIAQGSYVLTGQAVSLLKTFKILIAQGTYTLTGQAIALKKASKILIEQGTYTLSGQSVGLYKRFRLLLAQGTYTLTGVNALLKKVSKILMTQGTYLLTGLAVGLDQALKNKALAYWKFDESSGNATDATGNGYTLTNTNTVGYSSGLINNGADFGASNTNKYFVNTSLPNLCSYNSGVSVAFWFKLNSTSGSQFFFQSQDTAWSSLFARFASTTTLAFRFGNGVTSDGGGFTATVPTMTTGTWYHVAMTHSPTANNYYFNGSNVGTDTTSVTLSGGANGISLGAFYVLGDYLQGMLDEFGVWTRELSATDITNLYNSGVGKQYPFTPFYTLIMGLGTYILTGNDATFKRGLRMTIAQGTYTLTGFAVALKRILRILINQGSYVYTGFSVNMYKAFRLIMAQGSYALTGFAVSLKKISKIVMQQGTYILTGFDVLFRRLYMLLVETGSYTLTGFDVALRKTVFMLMQTGSYTLTGFDVLLKKAYLLAIETGQYILTGFNALIRRLGWRNQDKNTSIWTSQTKETSAWNNQSKNSSSWTNSTKETSNWTNETKESSSWTNQDKSQT